MSGKRVIANGSRHAGTRLAPILLAAWLGACGTDGSDPPEPKIDAAEEEGGAAELATKPPEPETTRSMATRAMTRSGVKRVTTSSTPERATIPFGAGLETTTSRAKPEQTPSQETPEQTHSSEP